jgi:hypothetical protein
MTEPAAPRAATSTLPPPSVNGSAPPPPAAPPRPARGRLRTRISGARTGLIAGTARITQLRRIMRRDRRSSPPDKQPS